MHFEIMQDLSIYLFLTYVTMRNETKVIIIRLLKEYFQNITYFVFTCWKFFSYILWILLMHFHRSKINLKMLFYDGRLPAWKYVALRVGLSQGSKQGSEKTTVNSNNYADGRDCVTTHNLLSAALFAEHYIHWWDHKFKVKHN